MSVPRETRDRLRDWGRWASGDLPYFRMTCALLRIGAGSRSTGSSEPNPEVITINSIVRNAERRVRKILITHYCSLRPIREKIALADITKHRYYQCLDEAQWFVHIEYGKSVEFGRTACYESPHDGIRRQQTA